MVRPHAPRRAELRPRRRDDEQRRLRPSLRQRAHQVERSRVGPVQVLEGEHDRLRPRGRQDPCRHRRQLSAAQLLWREFRRPVLWQEDIDQRREQRCVFGWIQTDEFQSILKVGQALFGGQVCAESVAAPFGDWVQRSVLQ
jgi:chromosome condensin MukBEF ATPase and DNA-binding subunit MukB